MEGGQGSAHIEFTIPARGLLGLRTRMMNATSGQAIMHHTFYDYQLARGGLAVQRRQIRGTVIGRSGRSV